MVRGVVRAMREIGIDDERLCRMVEGMQLERYVPALRGKPVLFVTGDHDRVDPPPSIERLERALRPKRSLHLDTGHATMTLFRRPVTGAIVRFLSEEGVLATHGRQQDGLPLSSSA